MLSDDDQTRIDIISTTIFVRSLRIEAEVGVYHHELGRKQTLLLDVHMLISRSSGAALSDTVDYTIVLTEARRVAASHVALVETFAERLACAILKYGSVLQVRVCVTKPGALSPAAPGAGVEIVAARRLVS